MFKINKSIRVPGLAIMDMSCNFKGCYGNKERGVMQNCICQINGRILHICMDINQIDLAEYLHNLRR